MSGQDLRAPVPLLIRLHPSVVDAIDLFLSIQPEPRPTREDMIGYVLRDWLSGLGLLPAEEGPETLN